jgi:hypothetical protein
MAMGSFEEALRKYSQLGDERLAEAWTWREGGPRHTVREALYRSLDEEQSAAAEALPQTEAFTILSMAQRAFGDLRGLLIVIEDSQFDKVPEPGEWTIRQTMAHMIDAELRYDAQVDWARGRRRNDPVRIPEDKVPPKDDAAGSLADLLVRLAHAREATDRRHADISSDHMRLPTIWGGFEVDVRFRLHRFAGHLIEHTIQCEKTLAMLPSYAESEARRIIRHLSSVRGSHEHISSMDQLRRLDETHLKRAHGI